MNQHMGVPQNPTVTERGMADLRRCHECGRDLPPNDFYRDRRSADGLRGNCKPCQNKRTRGRRAGTKSPRTKGPTYVYVVRDPATERVKIGITGDIGRRIVSLETTAGLYQADLIGLELFGSRDSAVKLEETLHRHWEEHHINGEWFDDYDGEIREWVKQHMDQPLVIFERRS